MALSDTISQVSGPEGAQGDEAQQWEQYLSEEHLWDYFLTFSPEAIQWTYNVQ